MFNDIFSSKIGAIAASSHSITNKNLTPLPSSLQMLNMKTGKVIDIEEGNNVIFTTINGERLQGKTSLEVKVGDRISYFIVKQNVDGENLPKVVISKVKPIKESKEQIVEVKDSLQDINKILASHSEVKAQVKYINSHTLSQLIMSQPELEILRHSSVGNILNLQISVLTSEEFKKENKRKLLTPLELLQDIFSEDYSRIGFTGRVVESAGRNTMIKTEFGLLQLEQKVKLPAEADIMLQLINIEAEDKEEQLNIKDNLLELEKIYTQLRPQLSTISNLFQSTEKAKFSKYLYDLIVPQAHNKLQDIMEIKLLTSEILEENLKQQQQAKLRELFQDLIIKFYEMSKIEEIEYNTWYQLAVRYDAEKEDAAFYVRLSNSDVQFLVKTILDNIGEVHIEGIIEGDFNKAQPKFFQKYNNLNLIVHSRKGIPSLLQQQINDLLNTYKNTINLFGSISFEQSETLSALHSNLLESKNIHIRKIIT